LLDLGTGWVHAYGLAAALVREADQVDLFDVQDLRNWRSFQATLEATIGEIVGLALPEEVRQRAVQRARDVQRADSYYADVRMVYQSGSADTYPPATFDRIFSVDVLGARRHRPLLARSPKLV
jgi:hypothetical protein